MVGFVVCAVEGLGDTDETLQVPAQHASHRFFSASLFSTFSFLNEFLSLLGGKSFIGISDAKVQEEELEDARWFSKDFVREALRTESEGELDKRFHVPSSVSLARTLIESWLAE